MLVGILGGFVASIVAGFIYAKDNNEYKLLKEFDEKRKNIENNFSEDFRAWKNDVEKEIENTANVSSMNRVMIRSTEIAKEKLDGLILNLNNTFIDTLEEVKNG